MIAFSKSPIFWISFEVSSLLVVLEITAFLFLENARVGNGSGASDSGLTRVSRCRFWGRGGGMFFCSSSYFGGCFGVCLSD